MNVMFRNKIGAYMPKMLKYVLLALLTLSVTVGCDKMRKMNPFKKKAETSEATTTPAAEPAKEMKAEAQPEAQPEAPAAPAKKGKKKRVSCVQWADQNKMEGEKRDQFVKDCLARSKNKSAPKADAPK